jgi:hypothetical protein
MHRKIILLCFFFLSGCVPLHPGSLHSQPLSVQREGDPIARCNTLPSNVSVFIAFKIPPFWNITFLVGNDFIHAQPSVSLSTPFLEIGIQDEFPVGNTRSDFLYLVVTDRNESVDKQRKIYCFDLAGKSIEIVPACQAYLPLRIIVSQQEMKIYQDYSEIIQYKTVGERHILDVDISNGNIESLEIKPLDSIPERLVKPEPAFKYCQEAIRKHNLWSMLVCPSDGLEFALGLFPRLIGRFSPTLGWVILLAVEGGVFIFLMIKVFDQKHFMNVILILLFIAWLVLVATNIWPYALLYP